MCEPTLIVAGIAALGAYMQADASKQQAKYQEKVEENNAVLAMQQAAEERKIGDQKAHDHLQKVAQLRGQQRASMAGRGLDLSFGAPADILEDTDMMGQIDATRIRDNAGKQAWGYEVQASNHMASAELYNNTAKNTRPWLSAAMSGVSAYASAGGKFANPFSKAGGAAAGATSSAGSGLSNWRGASSYMEPLLG